MTSRDHLPPASRVSDPFFAAESLFYSMGVHGNAKNSGRVWSRSPSPNSNWAGLTSNNTTTTFKRCLTGQSYP